MIIHIQSNVLLFLEFLNPETIIQYGGLSLLLFVIFAETGLFFGFFLPGDSLLFIAGLLSGSKYLPISVSVMIPALIIAALSGSTVGYFTGKWAGEFLEKKEDSLLFKKRYIEMTRDFYQKHGKMALILGRFLPIIRTFVTILAGMARISFSEFFLFNIVGAVSWILLMVLAGHWLGNIFPQLSDYLELIVLVIVGISVIPVIVVWMKARISTKGGENK